MDIETWKTYGATLFANRDFMAVDEKKGISVSEREGKNETQIQEEMEWQGLDPRSMTAEMVA